jgi:hypothetical protein
VNLQILPLAITMMAGPQIVTAIILVTTPKPIPVSLAFLTGVAIAATVGTTIAWIIANLLGNAIDFGDSGDNTSTGHIIQYALVGLLVLFALKNWRGRATAEPPKWLGTLMDADWKRALKTALLLIFCMPSDIVVMFTVGMNLSHGGAEWYEVIPFLVATVLIAALPFLGYVLFRRRAQVAMPKMRDWMNIHSWLVNIGVAGIFILLIIA